MQHDGGIGPEGHVCIMLKCLEGPNKERRQPSTNAAPRSSSLSSVTFCKGATLDLAIRKDVEIVLFCPTYLKNAHAP